MIRFGESENYKFRSFVLYDGLHYDPVHMPAPGIPGFNYTTFPSSDLSLLALASNIVDLAHKCGKFTDTDTFNIVCGECGHKMRGEEELVLHSKETSHTEFNEYKPS